MNKVEVLNVGKVIGKNRILDDVTFSCYEGQTLAIVGKNGSGKSTLFKTLVGIMKPSDGKVLINDIDTWINYKSVAAKVGFLIENPALYNNLTGKENLNIYFKMQCGDKSKYNYDIVKRLKIEDYLDKKVRKYSLGMKQRLGIACALIHNPEIIILDEPTNSLDAVGVKEIRELIINLNKSGKIIIIASHILKEVQELCTHYIFIDNGKIIDNSNDQNNNSLLYKITVEKNNKIDLELVLNSVKSISVKNNDEIYIENNEDLDSTLKILMSKNIKVLDIDNHTNNLEDYFIKKVGEV